MSVFPSSSVLFSAKPHRPLVRRTPNIRVATKPNRYMCDKHDPSSVISLSFSYYYSKQTSSTLSPGEESRGGAIPLLAHDNTSSGDRVRLPPVPNSSSLTASVNDGSIPITSGHKVEDRGHFRPLIPSGGSVKLPTLALSGSLVATKQHNRDESTAKLRSSPSHDSFLKPGGGKDQKSINQSSSWDTFPISRYSQGDAAKKSASSIKFQSQMKVTRYSTFKDTPLGYKPAPARNQTNKTGADVNLHDTDPDVFIPETSRPFREKVSGDFLTVAQPLSSSSERQSDTAEERHSMVSHSSHSPSLDEHLYQQAQRYDKLNQVLALLQHAQGSKTQEEGEGGHSEPGTPVRISELKAHIKTALDEAVRLRADTEALQQRVIVGVS